VCQCGVRGAASGQHRRERKGPPGSVEALFFRASRQESKAPMGKVHGSLARAGKVRGQTPKVAKQDKKKAAKGRAGKRIKYNRRFVNVVVGLGKKRSPNANS